MNKAWIAAGAVLLALFLLPKGAKAENDAPGGSGVQQPTEAQMRAAFQAARARFGADIARNAERIYRLETAHFKSGQFRATNTAGMRATRDTYPFGWKERGTNPALFAPVVYMAENAGGPRVAWVAFIRFEDALTYLCKVLQERGNNPGAWNSTDPARQTSYNAALQGIRTPFTDNQ